MCLARKRGADWVDGGGSSQSATTWAITKLLLATHAVATMYRCWGPVWLNTAKEGGPSLNGKAGALKNNAFLNLYKYKALSKPYAE